VEFEGFQSRSNTLDTYVGFGAFNQEVLPWIQAFLSRKQYLGRVFFSHIGFVAYHCIANCSIEDVFYCIPTLNKNYKQTTGDKISADSGPFLYTTIHITEFC